MAVPAAKARLRERSEGQSLGDAPRCFVRGVAITYGKSGLWLEHDPEKACPGLVPGGNRFSEKIMLHQ
jgi:hypothetical protein